MIKIKISDDQLDHYKDVMLNMADISCALSVAENMNFLLNNTSKKFMFVFKRKLTEKDAERVMHENGYFDEIIKGTVDYYRDGVELINEARKDREISLGDLDKLEQMVWSHKYNYGNHTRCTL